MGSFNFSLVHSRKPTHTSTTIAHNHSFFSICADASNKYWINLFIHKVFAYWLYRFRISQIHFENWFEWLVFVAFPIHLTQYIQFKHLCVHNSHFIRNNFFSSNIEFAFLQYCCFCLFDSILADAVVFCTHKTKIEHTHHFSLNPQQNCQNYNENGSLL